MNVEDLMTKEPESCRPQDTLAEAAKRMWERDCGFLPVVGATGKLAGVITDRDICMGALTQGRPLTEIEVARSMTGRVRSCRAADDVEQAAQTMAKHQVRRLPVTDDAGTLVGVVGLGDLIRASGQTRRRSKSAVHPGDVLNTLREICRPRSAPAEKTVTLVPKPPAESPAGTKKKAKAPADIKGRKRARKKATR